MPCSFWFIRSACVVLGVCKNWTGSWWDPIELRCLLKSIHVQVFCYYQLGVFMLPELQINVRSWRVRSTFREVFSICLNEFSEVSGALHRHLSAGRPCSSTDLQRTQFYISKGFCQIQFLISKISVTCQNLSELCTQFLIPGNEDLTCRHTHFMP